MQDLIVIQPTFTTRFTDDGTRTAPTGNAAECREFIKAAEAQGFRVIDARVYTGEEHACGGVLHAS